MRVCVVTVTYGNRFRYLKQVIDSALNEGVCKVIVVDNASEEESRNKLKNLEKELNDKIKVIYLPENTGSAGGFKRGLEEAYNDEDCEFILLLDDDNVLIQGSLQNLINYWNKLSSIEKIDKIMLSIYREGNRFNQLSALQQNNPELPLGDKNSFMGFNVRFIISKIKRRLLKSKKATSKNNKDLNIEYGEIAVSPYGGLFFNKKILDKIGFPNEKLFVYYDDYEFTYRLKNLGGKIYLITKSKILDIENYYKSYGHRTLFGKLLEEESDFRVYYNVRNSVFFEKQYRVDNPFLFNLNLKISLFSIFIISIFRKKINRYKIIKQAIKDGINGDLDVKS